LECSVVRTPNVFANGIDVRSRRSGYNQALERFVDSELQYGLGLAVEPRVLTDINATSGDSEPDLPHLGAGDGAQGPDQAGDR
jgi:hypothetical protein